MRLTVVVSDCPPSAGSAPDDAHDLVALSTLLSSGDRATSAEDWRALLTRRFAPTTERHRTAGAIAAAALPSVGGADAWLATPVHLQATPAHLRLPPGGLLTLAETECLALAEDFSRVFAGSGFALHPTRGRFVLSGLAAEGDAGPADRDPAALLGSRLEARALGAPARRRLSSEIELWLHEHPVNVARAARRLPAVSGLWLWAGGRAATRGDAPADTVPVRFFGDDAFLDGLAAVRGSARPAALPPWPSLDELTGEVVVQLTLSAGDAGHSCLAALEQRWLEPALSRVRRGGIESLELAIASTVTRLTRRSFARFWRRRRPWWEHLQP